MTESDLQKRIVRELRRIPGCTAIKLHGGPHQPIVLDIVGCYKGKYFELEVKRPGKEHTLTDRQRLRIRRVHEAGGKTGVVTSFIQAREIIYGK